MKRLKHFFAVLLAVVSYPVLAQNLVPNPGFEVYANCPGNFSQAMHEFNVRGWHPATSGTPDHFHACSAGEAGVPHNWAGVSDAYEGKGYAGIYLWMDDANQYREYLQCQLKEPLIRDSVYTIAFRYKLSSYSKYAVDRIGLLLTDSLISIKHDEVILAKPTLSIIRDSALTTTTGLWETATAVFKATGGERFLVIGNFFDNAATRYYEITFRPISQPMLAHSAYYYIDDVEVIPHYYLLTQEQQLLPQFSLPHVSLNKTYVLKNIQFDVASYRLIPPSFDELNAVAEYLARNAKMRLQVFGHTDDQGSDEYNLRLSRQRAESVTGYLVSLGMRRNRIEIFAYGKRKPLVEGNSPQDRALNRRVEIRFIK